MDKFRKTPKNKNLRDIIFLSIFILIITPTSIITQYLSLSCEESYDLPIHVPKVNIYCPFSINSELYVPAVVELDNHTIPSKLKYRGSIISLLPKKSFRLEFINEIPLLGMRMDDDWQLFSCWLDHTRMRTKLAFDLWRSLIPSNPTAILPDSKFVQLFINSEFQGLYLLAEKQDRRLFGLDDAQNNLNSSLILQSPEFYFHFTEMRHWEQDYPNEEDGIYIADQIIAELTDFINNTSNLEFFNEDSGIFSKFDEKNLIDFFLFNIFINHRDFWNHNYYIVRNTMPSKFFLIPWDFDISFGQLGWCRYESDEIYGFNGRNLLYQRLYQYEEFRKDVKIRWNELRAELWTKEYIFGLISEIYNQIQKVLEIDLEIWKPKTVEGYISPCWPDKYFYSNDEFDLNETIQYLYNWIEERLQFCDIYFNL